MHIVLNIATSDSAKHSHSLIARDLLIIYLPSTSALVTGLAKPAYQQIPLQCLGGGDIREEEKLVGVGRSKIKRRREEEDDQAHGEGRKGEVKEKREEKVLLM